LVEVGCACSQSATIDAIQRSQRAGALTTIPGAQGVKAASDHRVPAPDPLREVAAKANTGPSSTLYRYDADGNLVGEIVDAGTSQEQRITYTVDTQSNPTVVLAEAVNGRITRSYHWEFGNELVSFTDHLPDGSTVTRLAHLDAQGSIRHLTDRNGNITDSFTYDANGNVIARTGSTDLRFLFRGEQLNPNTGWYHLRARWMDPKAGRFASQDTFPGFNNDPRSLHKYAFAHNDPINLLDPSGMFSINEAMAGINVLATALVGVTPGGASTLAGLARKCPNGTGSPHERLCVHGDAAFKSQVAQVETKAAAAGINVFSQLRSVGRVLTHIFAASRSEFGANGKGDAVIKWDSQEGAYVVTRPHRAAYQSPALGLVHEGGHAWQVSILGLPNRAPLPELPVIRGVEEQWVQFYGEPRRQDDNQIAGGEPKEPMNLFEYSRRDFVSR
jgi:RHS repeat-associated protein